MSWLPRLVELGDLDIVETFVEFDGPRVFSARSATDQLFLAGWAEEGDEADIWLYLPVSEFRLRMVRSGRWTLRHAFTHPESSVYHVRLHHDAEIPDEVKVLDGAQLEESWLPTEDFALRVPTPTLPPAISPADLARAAAQEGRTRFRIEIDDTARMRSESSTRRVASLLNATQNVIDNFGLVALDADPAQDGRFSKQVLARMETDVLQLAAASFVIELGSTDGVDLLGDAPIAGVIERLIRLLSVDLSPDALWESLADLRPRAAKSFRGFVNELALLGSDVTVSMANTARSYQAQSLSSDQVATLRALLKAIVPDEVKQIRGRMELFSGDNERRLFGLRDLRDGVDYEGRVGELAIPQVAHATLGDQYDVVITAYSELDKGAGQTKQKYVLEQLTRPDGTPASPTVTTVVNESVGPIEFPR